MKVFDAQFREREDDAESRDRAIAAYSRTRAHYRELYERARDLSAADADELRAEYGRAVGRLGEAYRFAGRIAEAVPCKRETLSIWEELGRQRAVFLARLRLAIVLEQSDEPDSQQEGRQIFEELYTALRAGPHGGETADPGDDLAVYADFIFETAGLFRAREGRFDAARQEFERALRIRETRGRNNMIERTRVLLRQVGNCRPD